MAHLNAEIAVSLKHWSTTGEDRNGAFADGKRKGFIIRAGDGWVLSPKGQTFIDNWTASKRAHA